MADTTNLERLSGQIERVTYCNDETGYTIARLQVYGRRDLVTVVGNIVSPIPGATLKMAGEWTTHPRYGEQFKVVFYEITVPATCHGIEKYLGSGLIKGKTESTLNPLDNATRAEAAAILERFIKAN